MSDNDNDIEKPLKKARYVWQVKGKYHLKDTLKNNNSLNVNNNLEPSTCTNSASTSKVEQPHSIECKVAAIKECCVASVLATTEAIMDEIAIDNSPGKILAIQDAKNLPPSKRECLSSVNEDYFIKKWQALQRAKGFVDNTVNIVLENWMNPSDSHSDDEDGLNLFSNSEGKNGQLEDDAILMAIQSHGLSCAPEYYETDGTFTEDNLTNIRTELGRMETIATEGEYEDNHEQDSEESCMDFLQQAVSAAIQEKGLLY